MSFETLHFIRPLWLLALPLAVLLPWAWRRARRPAGDWARVCDPHLLRWLAVDQSGDKPRRGGPWLARAALAIASSEVGGVGRENRPEGS